ncbi:MAG: type IV pilus biogenesis/stability protein PilW [Pseudomonadales bacterium]|jgi:type IV pilus assembly protein PilF|nr:type IV pilus biogenesis/stability protein PilW [Pseudomonadales bacterium]MDP6471637.1 type IV pilus biogenesis/stability protein PilW [Pseudomonadales bacterium]MDP6973077.1 type IV pilus biogenesis/stability protein PilW [Pseudomonadales bacterium]|tara:strand:+ start:1106 stop:1855 length:750 start_codon:yes stop_codon:yes gene_type:complete
MNLRGCLLISIVFLGGCVTEITGGLPPPLPAEDRIKANLDLARGYLGKRDWIRARAPLDRALGIDPRSVETLVLFGVLYESQGDPGLAEEHYRRALEEDPGNSQALNNFGAYLYRQARFEEALTLLRRLVGNTQYRMRAQAYENLGLAELAAGDPSAAESAFVRALQLDYRQVRSTLELADLHFQRGDLRMAREFYDTYLNQASQTSRSLCVGVHLAGAEGDNDKRASYAMALENLYPETARECGVPSG